MWTGIKIWWWLRKLKSDDYLTSLQAGTELARFRESVPALIAIVKDTDEPDQVRSSAVRALAKMKSPRAVEPLLALAEDSRADVELRKRAIEGLAEMEERELLPACVKMLERTNQDISLQVAAAHAVAQLAETEDVPSLVKLLQRISKKATKRDEVEVVETLAGGLARLRDPRAFEGLAALGRHSVEKVRKAGARALGDLGDRRAIKVLLLLRIDYLYDEITAALKQLDWEKDLSTTVALAGDTTLPTRVRRAAVFALRDHPDRRALPVLTSLVKAVHEDNELRATAAEALAAIGDAGSLDLLLKVAGEVAGSVKSELTSVGDYFAALAKFKDGRCLSFLLSQLNHRMPQIRIDAIQALSKLGDARAIPNLIALLTDPLANVSRTAHSALVWQFKWKPTTPAERALAEPFERWDDEQWRKIREIGRERERQAAGSKKDRLRIGMSLDEIVALLGTPASSADASDVLAGAPAGSPPRALNGRAWYTWRLPEGVYVLTIQDGRLAGIQNAPA